LNIYRDFMLLSDFECEECK